MTVTDANAEHADTPNDPDLTAADIAWDLEPLVAGKGTEGVDELMARADEVATAIEGYRGRIPGLDAAGLAELMGHVADLQDALGRAGSYVSLRFAVDTLDAELGAAMQRFSEQATAISNRVLFVELEWAEVDDARATELTADPALEFCRHHLRSARRYHPYLLTEPEEQILGEKAVTGSSAWSRLFSELTSAITVDLPDGPTSLEQALSVLGSPTRDDRRVAAEAVTAALEPGLRTRGFVYNTLMADLASDDRLRGHDSWIASRNLSNEASDESVQALVDSVVARYDIPQRWYALKAQLLGVDRLADYDRNSSVADVEETFGWSEASELVLDAYGSFSGELAGVVQRFFDDRWVDAPVRAGKRPGAFCAYTVPSAHPYLLLNWTSRRRDVLTLAHELGHGLHAYLAREQGVFHQATPLTLAETASVFGETVTFGRLLDETTDPAARLALLAESLEGQIATVFRQVAMNRFEDAAHTRRRTEGELSVEAFGDEWERTQRDMLGDAVELTPGYRTWWSYIPHFIGTPGYVYAYAYGQLLALAVYARYEAEGAGFVPAYLDLLRAGGSLPPEELGRIVGVDLADPGFWDGGLAIIDAQLAAAEQAARDAGRL
ncbi:M3 family oligoendopeptidase [Rhabdothermincola salaria]|uniref:M3 family oligoendopeptidase n=1 Tax=Rhabdothermincola salaria TaxID=2903142 RepID=UPI001E2CA168|nr:M3 family oligoendopeptidase [Rhabdothermincola salaria]MCD9622820.1 M3 family oligoendopeptidase [Rhabdothermincola salaria]